MKKVLSLVFSLLLLLSLFSSGALANGYVHVKELMDEGITAWQEDYQTVRGDTVSVNLEIAIPDVEQFPCLEVKYHDPTDLLPTTKKNAADMSTLDNFDYLNSQGTLAYAWPSRPLRRQMEKAAKKNGTYQEKPGEPRHLNLAYGQFDLDTPYSVNNPSTVRSVTELLNHCINEYFPGQEIELVPRSLEAHIDPGKYEYNKKLGDYEKVADRPDFEGCLFVRYDQLIEGIPVIGYSYDGFFDLSLKSESMGTLGGDVITQGMTYLGSDDLYQHIIVKLLQVTKVKQKDVPLVPVSKVIEAAGNYIISGKLRSVDSLRLGYVAWLRKEGGFLLMPTWVIAGEVFENAQAAPKYPENIFGNRSGEYQYLYINAQTGEIIDPNQKASDRAYQAPKLITW